MAVQYISDIPDHAHLLIFQGDTMNDTFYVAQKEVRRISTGDWVGLTRKTQEFLCHLLPVAHDKTKVMFDSAGR